METFGEHMEIVRELETVMEESFDQDEDILLPVGRSTAVLRDHNAFSLRQGSSCMVSLPLRLAESPLGVLTCERPEKPFSEAEVRGLRLLCDQAAARLNELKNSDRPFAARLADTVRSKAERVGLNELGFDVDEIDIQPIEGGHKIRLRVQVVEPGHHRRRLEALTGLDVQENQARRLLNDLDHFRAWQGELAGRVIAEREAAQRWLAEVYRPALAAIPPERAAKLDPAEIFHQLLEHRWYASERAGRDLPLLDVVPSYVEEVLARLPTPEVKA